MQNRLKIHWGTEFNDDSIGNAYGYKIHSETLRKYVSQIADITSEADNIVMILSPEFYKPVTNKRNWLFTMFEGSTLPDIYLNKIKHCDYILTPSQWVKGLFEQYFPSNRIYVINHGVEAAFAFKKRKFPTQKPFRYLWLGAPNPRKGWEEIIYTWDAIFKDKPGIELYVKTTRAGGLQHKRNVILDGRDLSRRELIKLYHSAHCFVFPTRGEGFGLTLAEAMATGLPCVATDYSGVKDFFSDAVGYPIGYKMGPGKVTFIGDKKEYKTEIAFPDVEELAKAMLKVYFNYEEAVKKGEKASRLIKSRFTWPASARRLVDVISSKTLEKAA